MDGLWVIAGAGVLAGAAVQSAVGFGFALVAAPLLLAATEPEQAVGLSLVLGLVLNLLTIGAEGRRPVPYGRQVAVVLVSSLPGMVIGAFVLQAVSHVVLQALLTVAVFATLAVQLRAPRATAGRKRDAHGWASPLAGFGSGVLTTTTTTSGIPLVLLMLGRGLEPVRVRDTLTAIFLGLAVLGAAVLTATGTQRALPGALGLLALIALVVLGQAAGRPLFARLAAGHYEAVLTGVLVASATFGLVSTLWR